MSFVPFTGDSEFALQIAPVIKGGDTSPVVDGKSAYQIALDNGFVGTQQEWIASLQGIDGKTAYEIAVADGFIGTESEWLASLKGADGTGTGGAPFKVFQYDPITAVIGASPEFVPDHITSVITDNNTLSNTGITPAGRPPFAMATATINSNGVFQFDKLQHNNNFAIVFLHDGTFTEADFSDVGQSLTTGVEFYVVVSFDAVSNTGTCEFISAATDTLQQINIFDADPVTLTLSLNEVAISAYTTVAVDSSKITHMSIVSTITAGGGGVPTLTYDANGLIGVTMTLTPIPVEANDGDRLDIIGHDGTVLETDVMIGDKVELYDGKTKVDVIRDANAVVNEQLQPTGAIAEAIAEATNANSVSIISSGFSSISTGLSNTNSTVSAVSSSLSTTTSSVSAVSSGLSNVSTGLSNTNSSVSSVSSGLSSANSVVSSLSTGLNNIDASQVTTGTFNIARLPAAAIERLKIVTNQAARFALTTADIQNGDTVKQSTDGLMYFVRDDTNLSNASGYEPYTVGSASSVPWSGVTSTPTTLSGYGITDGATTAQVNAKMTNPMTTAADLIVGGSSGAPARLAVGSNGYFLSVVSGVITWVQGVLLNVYQTWTKNQLITPVTLISATTITSDAQAGDLFKLTLANNGTLDKPSNLADGMILSYSITEDGTGGRTLALHADFIPWSGSATTINTAANKNSLLVAEYRASTGKLYYSIMKEA